jgi:hypothetical protein
MHRASEKAGRARNRDLLRREVFIEVPPENEPYDPPPRPDSSWIAARRKSWARPRHQAILGRQKQRRAMWHVGKVDPAPETRRPDRFPGPPPVSRSSQGKRKCLSQKRDWPTMDDVIKDMQNDIDDYLFEMEPATG